MRRKMRMRMISLTLSFAMVLACMGGTFTISQAKASAVKLNVTNKKLKVGKSYQLKVKKKKNITIKKKTFSKKGAAIKITKKGKIQAKKAGKATVTCKVKYRKKNSKKVYSVKLKCKVVVTGTKSTTNAGNANQNKDLPTGGTEQKPGTGTTPGTAETPEPGTTTVPGTEETPEPGTTTAPGTEETPEPGVTSTPGTEETPEPAATSTPEITATDEPVATSTPKVTSSPTAAPVPTATATTAPTSAPTPTATASTGDETTSAFNLIHEMGLGTNLGNTMEAYCAGASTPTQIETNWGQPVTTQAMITGMKNAGFRSLRIPVSWSSMMSNDGNYTIDSALLQRIETIINYALNEDMYVIINIHWDGQWWGQFGDADSSVRAKAWARYEAFWTQISEYYKDYSDHLIFESANEELGERLNDNWADTSGSQTGVLTEDECYQTVNEINQKFVDIVRASGGNNPTRFLLIAGYDTDIDKTCDSRYVMPTDTIDEHMMVSIHYYTPGTYCISNNPANSWGYDASWGTEDDIAAMKAQLAKMKTTFADRGIPVVIGEYGVTDGLSNGSYVRKEGRDVFFKTVCEYAINHGMCPMLWDTNQVYNRSSCTVTHSTEAENYLALAQEAAQNEVYQPAGAPSEYIWSGKIQNSSYNQNVISTQEESNFVVTGNGGSFILSGVTWDDYQNPVIEITSDGLSGSCYCKFATSVTAPESDWPYVGDDDADIFANNWTFGSTLTIDLSGKNLSGRQSLYFSMNGGDFEGNITIRIKEKS
ncbi:MAG: cellulase family glycosylhydrolase [Eubacteriales bacterium]|nr:cellulase family glycosylhydrolase [Eubacteriales bacterium]